MCFFLPWIFFHASQDQLFLIFVISIYAPPLLKYSHSAQKSFPSSNTVFPSNLLWVLSGSPVVKTAFPLQETWVLSLVSELRSCMPPSVAKKKKQLLVLLIFFFQNARYRVIFVYLLINVFPLLNRMQCPSFFTTVYPALHIGSGRE